MIDESEKEKYLEIGNYFPFMPDSLNLSEANLRFPNLFLKHPINDSVTFFGGSFNPFHQGHRACLDLCPHKNILIILDRNPFKDLVPAMSFAEVLKLAESLKDTPYSIYPTFLKKKDGNPTSLWLPKVKIQEKNFLMGDDSFMSLLSWKNPDKVISSLTKLYVVPRNYESKDYLKQEIEIKKHNPTLQIIYLGDHPCKEISSSKERAQIT